MGGIPKATPIVLTEAQRAELEGLARSSKSEHRMRQRAQIVLLAAKGKATRAIARGVGCTIGTASKWRVRYAAHRQPGGGPHRSVHASHDVKRGRRPRSAKNRAADY